MTFQKIKEEVVDEKKWVTGKELRVFAIHLGLFMVCLSFLVSILAVCTVGLGVSFFVILFAVMGYLFIFDYCAEDERGIRFWMRLSKFWWVILILNVSLYLLLSYFHFL